MRRRADPDEGREGEGETRVIQTPSEVFPLGPPLLGFTAYSGDGYALLIPASWSPGKERAAPGIDL